MKDSFWGIKTAPEVSEVHKDSSPQKKKKKVKVNASLQMAKDPQWIKKQRSGNKLKTDFLNFGVPLGKSTHRLSTYKAKNKIGSSWFEVNYFISLLVSFLLA